jgi:thiosulfate reductase cytochrome b subunit
MLFTSLDWNLAGAIFKRYSFSFGEESDLQSPREAIAVTLHAIGLRKTLPLQGKYNSAQKIAYTAIVPMGCGRLLTGIAI